MRVSMEKLLSGTVCDCGKKHTCAIGRVAIGNRAAEEMDDILSGFDRVLAVADENTYNAAREFLSAAFLRKAVFHIFPGSSVLIPDEKAITAVTESAEDMDVLVAIGSGVIQDLCKYVSFQKKIPYVVFATAPSMDGYASSGAAMILGGMKVTVEAGLPRAIIGDTRVLSAAPFEMIQSGYGDIIGKYSALNDWKLSLLLTDEYFCRAIHDTVMQMVLQTEKAVDGLIRREEESVGKLMEALVCVGIMMSYAGKSRPASGSEHHLSHFFEITGILNGETYYPHGIDVGFSSVVTAQIRQRLLALEKPAVRAFDEAYWEREIKRVYQTIAPGVIELQKNAGWHWNEPLKISYEKNWGRIRRILAESPTDRFLKERIAAIGLDIRDFSDTYGPQKISDAVLYGMELKDRFTCLRLYNDLEML